MHSLSNRRNTMTDHSEFESHLDAHPDDWEYRLVYADWLEEHGDAFCETQRWMVANKQRAYKTGESKSYVWTWCENYPARPWSGHVRSALRPGVYVLLENQGGVKYPTRHAAEVDLHNALVKAGEISCALIEVVRT